MQLACFKANNLLVGGWRFQRENSYSLIIQNASPCVITRRVFQRKAEMSESASNVTYFYGVSMSHEYTKTNSITCSNANNNFNGFSTTLIGIV